MTRIQTIYPLVTIIGSPTQPIFLYHLSAQNAREWCPVTITCFSVYNKCTKLSPYPRRKLVYPVTTFQAFMFESFYHSALGATYTITFEKRENGASCALWLPDSSAFYLSIIRVSLLIELQLSHTWPSNTNEHVSHSLSTRMFLCTSLFSEYRIKSLTVYIPYITIVSSEGNFIYLPKQPQPLVTFSITEKLSIIGGTIFLRTTSSSESSSPSSICSMIE